MTHLSPNLYVQFVVVRLDSDYDKLNIKVRAEMGHGFEVEMVTGNRACNG
jgi:hypothetical protein